jgi:hypothetical protein
MAHVIRDAVDTYLAGDVDEHERDRLLDDTFGACPGLGERVPTRDEWTRGVGWGTR